MAITETRVGRRRLAWVAVLVVALVLAWVRWAPVRTLHIASGSMSPGLQAGDRVLVLQTPWASLDRGDVVVFHDPGGWRTAALRAGDQLTGDLFVKRVVGVGGDTVECCDATGQLTINGHPVTEHHLGRFHDLLSFSVAVPRGQLWVMGDNRDQSFDSRYAGSTPGGGFVPADAVTGTVLSSW